MKLAFICGFLGESLGSIKITYVFTVFYNRISDHLYAMFEDESPPWDVERKYRLANLEVLKTCIILVVSCLKTTKTLEKAHSNSLVSVFYSSISLVLGICSFIQGNSPCIHMFKQFVSLTHRIYLYYYFVNIYYIKLSITGFTRP